MRLAIVVALTCWSVGVARLSHAEPASSVGVRSDTAQTYTVDRIGTFRGLVHPRIVTILYFPDAVSAAVSSDDQLFRASIVGDSVVVQPARSIPPDAVGNISISTRSLKVSVMLTVAKRPTDAVAQIMFKPLTEAEAFERRVTVEVERRQGEVVREYEEKASRLAEAVREGAERLVLSRALWRQQQLDILETERNDENIILRVNGGFWLGSDVYLKFEIQNRDSTPFHLSGVQLREGASRIEYAAQVEFQGDVPAAVGAIGSVTPGQRGAGIVLIRNAGSLVDKALKMRASEHNGRRAVQVDGIRW